ncbi:MAG TPA: hypothetical protein VIJ87_02820, partial [Pyrinomonadaceae bacterium]
MLVTTLATLPSLDNQTRVLQQQSLIGCEYFRQTEWFAFEAQQPIDRTLILRGRRKSLRKADTKVMIDPHQPTIERAIVKRIQTQTVSRIQAICCVLR